MPFDNVKLNLFFASCLLLLQLQAPSCLAQTSPEMIAQQLSDTEKNTGNASPEKNSGKSGTQDNSTGDGTGNSGTKNGTSITNGTGNSGSANGSDSSGTATGSTHSIPQSNPSGSGTPKNASSGTPNKSSSVSTGKTDTGTLKATAGQPSSKGTAIVSGVVSDAAGARKIENAHVVLTKSNDPKKRLEVETGEDGKFAFNKLESGSWVLTVSAKDMLANTTPIILKSGEDKAVTVAMEDLEAVDVMRISGKRTLVHPDNIGSETSLDHKFIYQYKSGNDLRDIINSTPGVINDSFGNIITRGEHNSINYELDGVVIPEAAGVLQQSQLVSPRSLQSVKVDIGGYQASDGGGPLGAVTHMKSLPIEAKPNFMIGHQLGGPLAGSIYYTGSTAFSQDPNSIWNRVRIESSGQFRGNDYRLAPPTKNYVNDWGADVNSLTKLEFMATERDTFRITTSINDTYSQLPESKGSRNAGYHGSLSDQQNYVILSYFHKFQKYFDDLNFHIVNCDYGQEFHTSQNFDPYPNFNNGQPLESLAVKAERFNYVFSAQGAITKTVHKEHHFKLGFLSEVRPERTTYNANYYNADLFGSLQQQAQAEGQVGSLQQQIYTANTQGNPALASSLQSQLTGVNTNPFPFGALISPFTGQLGGPQFQGNVGRFHGLRYLQSAYFQDKYTPQNGFWKRLTLDAGLRFDMQHSYYGNALPLYETIAQIPGITPFSIQPYLAQVRTDSQVSGRYGAAFAVTKNTILRGSYSDLFMPNAGDYFLTPFQVVNVAPTNGVNAYGVYDGTQRPLHATRGQLVDTSIERQFGPRFSTRVNGFYKYINNFGDSGVVGNLPLYNRLTNSAQDAYGTEIRADLHGSKEGYGFNGFLSETVVVAYLRGTKQPSGGFFTNPAVPIDISTTPGFNAQKFPDHDRRLSSVAGVGYKTRQNIWALLSLQVLSGLQDERDPTIFGPHTARTPAIDNLSLSCGYTPSQKILKKYAYMPNSFDCRMENLLNQRVPVNIGSPFQGTRFNLPLRVLVGCSWQLGEPEAKLSAKPAPNSIRALAPTPSTI